MNHEEIRNALDAATPGPWTAHGFTIKKSNGMKIRQERPQAAAPEAWERINAMFVADAHLIANAPTWLRTLLEENEQLRKQNKNIVESWNEQKEEIRSLRAGYTSANAKNDEELYFWEPFAENHLETLTGGVVIRAEWMRQLINEATQQLREELEQAKKELEQAKKDKT